MMMENMFSWFVLAFLGTSVKGCSVLVEKGHGADFQCTVPNTAKSITWQLMYGTTSVPLSTCNFLTNQCTDRLPSFYKGSIIGSGSYRGMNLNVIIANINETHFSCVADNGVQYTSCDLEVYAWPTKPRCSQTITDDYVDYTCITDNVYPGMTTTIHRRESDFESNAILSNITHCYLGVLGSGSDGDYSGTCIFRIAMGGMQVNNTVYVEMVSIVSNDSLKTRPPAISDDVTAVFRVPEINVNADSCPVGSGVRGRSVLIGTVATCKCETTNIGFPAGYAQWYSKDGRVVGVENVNDRSSTLTFNYNASDPAQVYECRPYTPISATILLETYTPSFRCSYALVEKGQRANINCPVLINTATSITWQVWIGTVPVNISTCTLADNRCTDQYGTVYQGYISISGGNRLIGLTVIGVIVNHTQFSYVTNNGFVSPKNELEVYAWPKKPNCIQGLTNTFVEHTCTTDNVFPSISASLRRRERNFTQADFDMNYSECTLGKYGSGTEGDYSATCTWRIPMTSMMTENHIYVEMSPALIDSSLINRAPSVSDDYITELTVPGIVVYTSNCPVGPGVRPDSSI